MKKNFNKKIIFPISILIIVFIILGIQLAFGNNSNVNVKEDKEVKTLSKNTKDSKKDDKKNIDKKEESLREIEVEKEEILEEEQDKNLENIDKKEESTTYVQGKAVENKPIVKQEQKTVTISIVCFNDSISSEKDISIEDGQTVFDVLKNLAKKENIQIDFSGLGNNIYIKGIANIYEFDKGPESGWMYRINGVFSNRSCSGVTVKQGDKIEWLYTRDLGKDIGNGY